jgi:hypothetical protein
MGHYSQLTVRLKDRSVILFAPKDAFAQHPENTPIKFIVEKKANLCKGANS